MNGLRTSITGSEGFSQSGWEVIDVDTIWVALFPIQLAVTCSIFYSYMGDG